MQHSQPRSRRLAAAQVGLALWFALSTPISYAQNLRADPPPPPPAERHRAPEFVPADYHVAPTAPTVPQTTSAPPGGSWSTLLFASARSQTDYDLYTAKGDGTQQTRVTFDGSSEYAPSLNRGGTQMAFQISRDDNTDIYVANVDGSGLTRLTYHEADDYWPTWSPDGTRLAFFSYRDGSTAELYVMNADGSNPTRLTYNSSTDSTPSWSPDGQQLVYYTFAPGYPAIARMNADGSGVQTLAVCSRYCYRPMWSPDGTRIVFAEDANADNFDDITLMNADGTGRTVLAYSAGRTDYAFPTWAPDGQNIVFAYIHWVLINGEDYWDTANLIGMDVATRATYGLVTTGYDWFPDWKTTDTTGPTTQLTALPTWSPALFTVQWAANDVGGAGVRKYDVQYRDGSGGAWTDWLLNTTFTSSNFLGQSGHTYYFRARASDNAFNWGAYTAGDTSTTVDATAPTVQILALPTWVTTTFTVQWTGTDANGSGLQHYDVQSKDGTGGWTDWQVDTTQTSATFTGQANHTYYFRARAQDNVLNVSDYTAGNSSTTVDLTPPTSAATSPLTATELNFLVNWSGSDAGVGLTTYDVQYRVGLTGTWTTWQTNTTRTNAGFTGQLNQTYYFQARARDALGNLEPYPGGNGDTTTHTPVYALTGQVLGNQGQPIALATAQTAAALNTPLSDGLGNFTLYFDQTSSYSLTVARTGFGALPPMKNLTVPSSIPTFYLPPADDQIVNGGFETADLAGWTLSGDLTPTLSTLAHTGDYALALGGVVSAPVVSPTAPFSASVIFASSPQVLAAGFVAVALEPGVVATPTVFSLNGPLTTSTVFTGQQDLGLTFQLRAEDMSGPLTATLMPFTVTLTYDEATWQAAQVPDENTLQVWHYDAAQMLWHPLLGTHDPVSNTLVVTTTALGDFALWGVAATGPWTSAFEQTLTVPQGPSATLSLLYHNLSLDVGDVLAIEIVALTQTLTTTLTESGDGHWWWELPTSVGPTATVRFELQKRTRTSASQVVFDEISLGTARIGAYQLFLPLTRGPAPAAALFGDRP